MATNSKQTRIEPNAGYSKSILKAINSLDGKIDQLEERQGIQPVAAQDASKDVSSGNPIFSFDSNPERAARRARPRKSISLDSSQRSQQPANDTQNISHTTKWQSVNEIDSSVLEKSIKGMPLVVNTPSPCSSLHSSQISIAKCDTASTTTEFDDVSTKESITSISFAVYAEAMYACSPDIVKYAHPYCQRTTLVMIAAKSGETSLVRYLAQLGANLNAKDEVSADLNAIDGHGKAYYHYLPPITDERGDDYQDGKHLQPFSFTQSFQRMGSLKTVKRAVRDLFILPGKR
ncbi:hypothetical protein DdX_01907 [Ditylenchus destructor]|uniref:Ankyrin repeat protein n=1 Tax=Ditylenchus destructor TaxID=166010 RepID=A0AAD4NBR5_9BILA|nr:hypothetical protein DdX_01907 [Ditylenchus destructor]